MKNRLSMHDLFAVSANNKESALNTEQTLDTSLLVRADTVLGLVPRREQNSDELTGKEEPDTVYDLGALGEGPLPFDKAQAQHLALLYAYALGSVSTAAYGTGYKHTIVPTSDIDLPSFTAAMRMGRTLLKRRFASMFVDSVSALFEKDSWVKASGTLKGTGKYTDSVIKETVNAAYNAVSLTLAANAVQGATAAERLDSVHHVRAKDVTNSQWVDVVVTAVSAATPAVLTIEAPGGVATLTDYEIIYAPTEAAWCTFPARVEEPPLRVTDLVLKIGGKWNGTSFLGGHQLDEEVISIEHTINNSMLIEFRVGGASGDYANYARRQGRVQALKLNREMRDFFLQQRMLDNDYFGVYLKATGAEFETGKNYYTELVFPRCNVLQAPLKVDNKVVAEEGDLVVLEDDTYGSVRVQVANKVATYAA